MIYDELFGWENPPPTKKRRRKTPKKDLEGVVVEECLQWLADQPNILYAERRNTGAVAFEDGGFMRFGAVGAADIFCLILVMGAWPDGEETLKHVEVEAKRRDGKGKLSVAQKKFKKKMLDIGVPYLVVTSAEDLEKQLQELGLTD